MSAQNAKDAAEAWIASAGLPDDLAGRVVQLVTFQSDEDARFFYPRRALIWTQQTNTYISRALRGRKAKIVRMAITPETYRTWLRGRMDVPERRREYADGLQRLIEPA